MTTDPTTNREIRPETPVEPDATAVRVVIVDDHRVVRLGLESLLAEADGIVVVGAASDGAEGVDLVHALQPDVVLMDLSMPGMDGIEATRRLAERHPDVNVVVLTTFGDSERVLDAVDAGAVGYLLKDIETDALVAAIRQAADGLAPLDPRAARSLLDARNRPRGPELSDREREVLVLVARGLLNKQIALRLGIAEATVKAHLSNIFGRLGVTDRTQAALWAKQHGMV